MITLATATCLPSTNGIMNLRVDDDPNPMAALWRVFNNMQPLMPYYKERPDNPEIGRVYDWAKARGIDF